MIRKINHETHQKQAIGTQAMVATAFPSAADASAEILRAGGNAVDAAIAAAWALAVCEPSGSGLGGQTILLVRFSTGKVVVIDGHSYAPLGVSKKSVNRSQQCKGYRACTIPSTPATLGFAQRRYGVLPLERVMEPAVRLAEEGYPITKLQRRQMHWCRQDLSSSPATRKLFLKKGRPYRVGDIFLQEELAYTLRRLASCGTEDFYHGEIARAIVQDMSEHGGLITQNDLANFRLPVERDPISINYRDHQVLSAGSPAGGVQVLLGLKILEHFSQSDLTGKTERWYEILAGVVQAVFRERERWSVHPQDIVPSLYEWLLGDDRAQKIAEDLWLDSYEESTGFDKEEPGETTHICVADDQGNIVGLSQSIQSIFGAKVANGKLGFLYNNYLCTCPRRHHPYRLASGCIPQSNAAPTLVLRNPSPSSDEQVNVKQGRPFLILGAAGGRRITSSILQVISGILDCKLSVAKAVGAPRVHALPSRSILVERPAATELLQRCLEKRFRTVIIKPALSFSMGAVQAIGSEENDTIIGVADPRRDGMAVGL